MDINSDGHQWREEHDFHDTRYIGAGRHINYSGAHGVITAGHAMGVRAGRDIIYAIEFPSAARDGMDCIGDPRIRHQQRVSIVFRLIVEPELIRPDRDWWVLHNFRQLGGFLAEDAEIVLIDDYRRSYGHVDGDIACGR
jgi:hypothetical protein